MSKLPIEKLIKKFGDNENLQLTLRGFLEKYSSLNETSKSEILSQAKRNLRALIGDRLVYNKSRGLSFLQAHVSLLSAIFVLMLILGMKLYY